MGHCCSASKFKPPRTKIDIIARSIEDFEVDSNIIHSLPFPGLQSRLGSAITLSFLGLQKRVICKVIVLSRGCRAYIITQVGLPGFLLENYGSLAAMLTTELNMTRFCDLSNMFEFCDLSYKFNDYNDDDILKLTEVLGPKDINEKIAHIKHREPSLYVAYLTSEGNTKELKRLCEGFEWG